MRRTETGRASGLEEESGGGESAGWQSHGWVQDRALHVARSSSRVPCGRWRVTTAGALLAQAGGKL